LLTKLFLIEHQSVLLCHFPGQTRLLLIAGDCAFRSGHNLLGVNSLNAGRRFAWIEQRHLGVVDLLETLGKITAKIKAAKN
jgi:hypothetical protein